jgi:glucose-6-phosphate isomerase
MEKKLTVEIEGLSDFIPPEEIMAYAARSSMHLDELSSGTGKGNDFLGWINLPRTIIPKHGNKEQFAAR